MKRISAILAAATFVISFLPLAGWLLHIDLLQAPDSDYLSMHPLTAISFMLWALAFGVLYTAGMAEVFKFLAKAAAFIIVLAGALTVAALLWDFKAVENLLLKVFGAVSTGQMRYIMAPGSALMTAELGAALFFSASAAPRRKMPVVWLALCVLLTGFAAFLGYLYRVSEYVNIGNVSYLRVSPLAAVAMIFSASALLAENDKVGLMAIITGPRVGSALARRLIPVLILVPVIIGYMRLFISWRMKLSVELGTTMIIISIIGVFLSVMLFVAAELNASDEKRLDIKRQLKQQAELFMLLPDAVLFGKLDNTIVSMNPAAREMFGVPEEQTAEFNFDELVTLHISQSERQNINKILMDKSGYWKGELGIRTHKGKNLDLLCTIKMLRNEQGEIIGWLGVYSDISALKRIQERLELVMKGTEAGVWDWYDLNSPERWWSPKYYEILGYADKEIPANFESLVDIIHPDDRALVFGSIQAHILAGSHYAAEFRVRTKSGAYKWVYGTGHASFDPQGNATRMVGSMVDIDERVKAQHVVRQQADVLAMIPDAVVYGGMDGCIQYMNKSAGEMFNTDPAQSLGKRFDEVMHFNLFGKDIRKLGQEMMEKGALREELEVETAEGRKLAALGTATFLYGQTGEISGWMAIFTDISMLRLNSKLQAANDYLEQLAYISAHDIKSPIHTLTALVHELQKSQHLKTDEQHLLELELEVLHKMELSNKALNDILELRKNLREKGFESDEPSTLEHIIKDGLEKLSPEIAESGALVHTDLDSAAQAFFPAQNIGKVFYLLAANSLKFSEPGRRPEIWIQANKKEDETVLLTVADNGSGFDLSRHRSKVFGMFRRFHPDATGTGTGLHIAKSIIDAYGGKIDVSSEPGIGTRFEISIKPLILA